MWIRQRGIREPVWRDVGGDWNSRAREWVIASRRGKDWMEVDQEARDGEDIQLVVIL